MTQGSQFGTTARDPYAVMSRIFQDHLPKEASVKALPHPTRMEYRVDGEHNLIDALRSMYRANRTILTTALADTEAVKETALRQAMVLSGTGDKYPHLLPEEMSSSMGEMVLTFERHKALDGVIMQTTDALEELLAHTDIHDTLPASLLRLPYPTVYLECGQNRHHAHYQVHHLDQTLPLEGIYLSEGWLSLDRYTVSDEYREIFGISDGGRYRVIDVCAVGSPIDLDNAYDDAWRYFTIPIVRDDESIASILDKLEQFTRVHAGKMAGVPLDVVKEETSNILHYVMKAMLYLGSSEIRQDWNREHTEAMERIKRVAPKKQAKLRRQAARAYDRIVVGPTRIEGAPEQSGGRTRAAHVRRGHFRSQRFGQGLAETKVIWIAPTFVNKDLSNQLQRKGYKLR